MKTSEIHVFKDVSATNGDAKFFALNGGLYSIQVVGDFGKDGTVTLARRAADETTFVPVLPSFTGNAFVTQPLPSGTYGLRVAGARHVFADLHKIHQ